MVTNPEEVLVFSDQLLKKDNLILEKEQVRIEKLDFQTKRKLTRPVLSAKLFALRYVKEARKYRECWKLTKDYCFFSFFLLKLQ